MLQHNAEHIVAFGTILEIVYRWTSVVHGQQQWTHHFIAQTQHMDSSLCRRSSAWVWGSGVRCGGVTESTITKKLVMVVREYSRTPLIRTLVIRTASYPEWHDPSGKFVENSTKLTCLEITGYQIKYSTVLWFLELQIRRGRKV
jgi:hypothetical protein